MRIALAAVGLLIAACPAHAQFVSFPSAPETLATGISGDLEVGDVDGNGRPDAAVAAQGGIAAAEVFSDGINPTFTTRGFLGTATVASPSHVAFGDITGGGLDELAVCGSVTTFGAGAIDFYDFNGSDFVLQASLNGLSSFARFVELSDFDGDGDADLSFVLASGSAATVEVYRNVGSFAFTFVQSFPMGSTLDVRCLDHDGDTIPDLIVLWGSGVSWLEGVGDGTFFAPQAIGSNSHQGNIELAVGDLNNDGAPDYVTSKNSYCCADPGIATWLSLGYSYGTYFPNLDYYWVDVADLDGDGFEDVVAGAVASSQIWIYQSDPANPGSLLTGSAVPLPAIGSGHCTVVQATPDAAPDILVSSNNELRLFVQNAPQAVASFTATPNPASCGQLISFDGSASTPLSGPITEYSWDFGDGNTFVSSGAGLSPLAAHAYGSFGSYTVQLTITDSGGNGGSTSTTVDITQGNSPPTAVAGVAYGITTGDDLTLDGSLSSDPDIPCGDSLTYEWELNNDGMYDDASGVTPFLSEAAMSTLGISSAGSHPVALRVTDSFGATDSNATNLLVTEPVLGMFSSSSSGGCGDGGLVVTNVHDDGAGCMSVQVTNTNPNMTYVLAGKHMKFTYNGGTVGPVLFPPTTPPLMYCRVIRARTISCSDAGSGNSFFEASLEMIPSGIPTTGWLTVSLFDGGGLVLDEVRISDLSGYHPDTGFGTFRGRVLRTSMGGSGEWAVERIPSVDSDAGSDWTAETTLALGPHPINGGPRGTDTMPMETLLINEIDASPADYIELCNPGPSSVDLQGWALRVTPAPGNGVVATRILPFPQPTVLGSGDYLVIGDGPTQPAELPFGVTYVDLSSLGPQGGAVGNIPLTASQPFQVALYDVLGRCIDALATTGHDDELVSNRPRIPSHWSDFTGAVRRDAAITGDEGIGRLSNFDTNTGADWRGIAGRSMGSVNTTFGGPMSHGDVLSARVFESGAEGGVFLVNAGAAAAGLQYGTLFSVFHSDGAGPFLGLGWDALLNFAQTVGTPLLFGALDGNGAARIELLPGFFPAGWGADVMFYVVDPTAGGALYARTLVVPLDT